jgi:GNAT superfamily N-acetyltransferase
VTSPTRKATSADVPRLAHVLALAFFDDPGSRWFFPDQARRVGDLERWFQLALDRLYLRHHECYTTAQIAGGALWVPPGAEHLGTLEQLRLLPAAIALFGRRLPRVLRAVGGGSKRPKERHYYLPFMGVEPASQGKGIGAALLRPVLERCDQERVGAYLEATTPRNRALYERNDFEVIDETRLPDGPPLWLMWRDPATNP